MHGPEQCTKTEGYSLGTFLDENIETFCKIMTIPNLNIAMFSMQNITGHTEKLYIRLKSHKA